MSIYPAELENAEPLTLHHPVIYSDINFDVGKINGIFFGALRDEGRILATHCPECDRSYLPPRMSCHACFAELQDWVDAGHVGTLQTFTIVRQPGMLQPQELPPPYVLGLIKLDGADTALVHYLGEVDPETVKVGMRVMAVLVDERKGNIWDIRYFKPGDTHGDH